jgi:flagellar P-ring protein precursor FlgI
VLGGINLSALPQLRGQRNHPTSGRIPNGAIVEKEALGQIEHDGRVHLLLEEPDYATAQKIASAINAWFGGLATRKSRPTSGLRAESPAAGSEWATSDVVPASYGADSAAGRKSVSLASVVDAGTVEVVIPNPSPSSAADLVSQIGLLEVVPDMPARVVINERTGTVIVGHQVRVDAVAIAHGSLVIKPEEPPIPPAPGPALSSLLGIPPQAPSLATNALQPQFLMPGELPPGDKLNVLEQADTVADLARALNALGVTPKDLIAIFQALKESGALHAELIIM